MPTNLTNVLIGEDWTVWRVDFSAPSTKQRITRPEKPRQMRSRSVRKIQALKRR